MTEISQTIKLSTQKRYLHFSMWKVDCGREENHGEECRLGDYMALQLSSAVLIYVALAGLPAFRYYMWLAAWLAWTKEDVISNYWKIQTGSKSWCFVAKLPFEQPGEINLRTLETWCGDHLLPYECVVLNVGLSLTNSKLIGWSSSTCTFLTTLMTHFLKIKLNRPAFNRSTPRRTDKKKI